MSHPSGTVLWNEHNSHRPAEAAEFYARVHGWRIELIDRGPLPSYRVGWAGEVMAAGFYDLAEIYDEPVDPYWLAYIETGDTDAMAATVVDAGGRIVRAPFDVPHVGRLATVRDHAGAIYGLMQPEPTG